MGIDMALDVARLTGIDDEQPSPGGIAQGIEEVVPAQQRGPRLVRRTGEHGLEVLCECIPRHEIIIARRVTDAVRGKKDHDGVLALRVLDELQGLLYPSLVRLDGGRI